MTAQLIVDLSKINSPTDLRRLNTAQLPAVCEQLREYLIKTVAARGGHFAAGLGLFPRAAKVFMMPLASVIQALQLARH